MDFLFIFYVQLRAIIADCRENATQMIFIPELSSSDCLAFPHQNGQEKYTLRSPEEILVRLSSNHSSAKLIEGGGCSSIVTSATIFLKRTIQES